jgi:hypothetical protein
MLTASAASAADVKVSALTELTAPDSLDEAVLVDKSDTTQAATGSTKKITVRNLIGNPTNGSLLFASNGTLAQDNANFFVDDINNRLGIGTNSSLRSPLSIASSNATSFTNLAGSSVKAGSLNSLTTYTTDPATTTDINYFGTLLNISSGTPTGTTEIVNIEGRTDAGTSTAYATMNGLAVRLTHAGSGTQSAQQGLFLQTGTPDGSSGSSSNPTAGRFSVILAGNGTTSIAQAASASVQSSGVNAITTAYGYRLTGITNTGGGTITNTYGVYIDDITSGTQTNTPFSFYAADAGALNYFAGKTGINQTAPTSMLDVVPASSSTIGSIIKGAASQTADLTQWQNSSGTVVAKVASGGNLTANVLLSNALNSNDNSISLFAFDGASNHFYSGAGASTIHIPSSGFVGVGVTAPVSTFEVAGGFGAAITTKTANYTATASDHTILVDATAGAITITLPAASGATRRIYVIKKIDSSANAVTVDPNASETLDGATTRDLSSQYDSYTMQSDAVEWWLE